MAMLPQRCCCACRRLDCAGPTFPWCTRGSWETTSWSRPWVLATKPRAWLRSVGLPSLPLNLVSVRFSFHWVTDITWIVLCNTYHSAFKTNSVYTLSSYWTSTSLNPIDYSSAHIVKFAQSNQRSNCVGDRVTVEPGDPCGKCEFCRSGHYNNCVTACFHASPVPNPGCLSHYFIQRADFCFK